MLPVTYISIYQTERESGDMTQNMGPEDKASSSDVTTVSWASSPVMGPPKMTDTTHGIPRAVKREN